MHPSKLALALAPLALVLFGATVTHAQSTVDRFRDLERMRASGLFFVHTIDSSAWAILAPANPNMASQPLRSRPRGAESDVILRTSPVADAHRELFGHVSGGAVRLAHDRSACDARLGDPVIINMIYLDNLQNDLDESSINVPRAPAAVDRLLARLARDPQQAQRLDGSLWVAAPIQGACPGALVGTVFSSRPPRVFVLEWLEGQELARATSAYQQSAVFRSSEAERRARSEEPSTVTATRFVALGAPGDISYYFVATEYESVCGEDASAHHAAFTHRAGAFTVLPLPLRLPQFLGDLNGDGLLEVLLRDGAGGTTLHQLDLSTNTLTPVGAFHTQRVPMGC